MRERLSRDRIWEVGYAKGTPPPEAEEKAKVDSILSFSPDQHEPACQLAKILLNIELSTYPQV